jgi:hypothetical protein
MPSSSYLQREYTVLNKNRQSSKGKGRKVGNKLRTSLDNAQFCHSGSSVKNPIPKKFKLKKLCIDSIVPNPK